MYDLGAFGVLSCGYMMSPSARMVLWSPTSMLSTLDHANCPRARQNTIVLRPDKPWMGFSFLQLSISELLSPIYVNALVILILNHVILAPLPGPSRHHSIHARFASLAPLPR